MLDVSTQALSLVTSWDPLTWFPILLPTAYCVPLILCSCLVGQMHLYAVRLEEGDGIPMT